MNLIRYNPYRRVRKGTARPSRSFDDLFDDFFAPFVMTGAAEGLAESFDLKVDIYEKDNAVMIDAELPGMTKEDISVDINDKTITLRGERKSDEEIKEQNCYRRERRFGTFERTFSLPFAIDGDRVKATYSDGILKLEIAKPEEQQAKKITIN